MKSTKLLALALAALAIVGCEGSPTAPSSARSATSEAAYGRSSADPVQVSRTTSPFTSTVDDKCTGEQVALTGVAHTVTYTRTRSGRIDFYGYQYTTDVTGIGLSSGTAYRAFDLDVFGVEFALASSSATGELVRRYFVTKGKRDNLYVEMRFKAVFDPVANAIVFVPVSTKSVCFNLGDRRAD